MSKRNTEIHEETDNIFIINLQFTIFKINFQNGGVYND